MEAPRDFYIAHSMKCIFLLILMFLLSFSKEAGSEAAPKVCSLKDRFFVQQVNDIYLNPESYKDQIIKVEGFFNKYIDEGNIERYVVYRQTAGCCGDDGSAGFEFAYKKGKLHFEPGQWILVEARLAERSAKSGGYSIIFLDAISVVEKPKGKGFVN
jgi:uncharacterized membrane protein YcgQ (UPF0703/DUF1980 family)